MSLSRLIYASHIDPAHWSEDSFERIIRGARAFNQVNGVTGLLLFKRQRFLQLLEGSRECVADVMSRVHADPRHRELSIISVEDIDERLCATWSMAIVPEGRITRPLLGRFFATADFEPHSLSADGAVRFCSEIEALVEREELRAVSNG